ncbi:uncharacterized protein LOC117650751 [Thrips palmi]|uniref:Uncharacterized protein LOC117650751 n=1 Tax=Thrips palmi TaxID=161013 RepID=A0A6P8ZXV4_THRPL|nr:uncharacterized protein LOC117650751 [Thrips palmi]
MRPISSLKFYHKDLITVIPSNNVDSDGSSSDNDELLEPNKSIQQSRKQVLVTAAEGTDRLEIFHTLPQENCDHLPSPVENVVNVVQDSKTHERSMDFTVPLDAIPTTKVVENKGSKSMIELAFRAPSNTDSISSKPSRARRNKQNETITRSTRANTSLKRKPKSPISSASASENSSTHQSQEIASTVSTDLNSGILGDFSTNKTNNSILFDGHKGKENISSNSTNLDLKSKSSPAKQPSPFKRLHTSSSKST